MQRWFTVIRLGAWRVQEDHAEYANRRIGPIRSGDGMMHHQPARQVFRYRSVQGGVTVEMVIWSLPRPSAERPHGLKYRLYCGRGGRCIVRYDNEAGKGDHRHYGEREETYRFASLEKLLQDFREDCTRLAGWRWQ